MSETKIVAGREYVVFPKGKIGKRVIRLKSNDYRERQGMRTEELRREHKLVLWTIIRLIKLYGPCDYYRRAHFFTICPKE